MLYRYGQSIAQVLAQHQTDSKSQHTNTEQQFNNKVNQKKNKVYFIKLEKIVCERKKKMEFREV